MSEEKWLLLCGVVALGKRIFDRWNPEILDSPMDAIWIGESLLVLGTQACQWIILVWFTKYLWTQL